MTVCRYFQQGSCRFGERCKFEHPGQVTQARPPQQNQNRYGALNNPFGSGAARPPARNGRSDNKYNLDPDVIKTDLTTDRPLWPFSAYGPVKTVPRQLMEGPVEQSPEEVRFRFYALGNPQQGAAEEMALLNETNQQVQSILNDLDGAIRFVCEGDNVHPNRNDICQQKSAANSTNNAFARGGSGPSGQQPPTGPSAFGAGNKPGGFSQPSFGAPGGGGQQQQQQSAFGAPASFSQANQGGSAFGAPSSLVANSTFGKPAFGAPAFGQPANPNPPQAQNQGMSFGAPAFGRPANQNQNQNQNQAAARAFGQHSQPSAFGQPAGGAFGQPAFGQPGGGSSGGGGFGQAAPAATATGGGGGAFGKPAATPGFGQPAFGQAATPQSGGFPSSQPAAGPFGHPQQQQQQQPQPTQSAFGQPTQLNRAAGGNPFQTQQTQNSAFGQPQQQQQQQPPITNGTTTTTSSAPLTTPAAHHFTTDPSGQRLLTWKGHRVEYIAPSIPCYRDPSDNSGSLIRIWHAAPPAEKNPFHEAPPETYGGDAGKELEDAYRYLQETGTWRDGVVPEVPPKMEWVSWDV